MGAGNPGFLIVRESLRFGKIERRAAQAAAAGTVRGQTFPPVGNEGRDRVCPTGYRVPVREIFVDWFHVIHPPVLVTESIP